MFYKHVIFIAKLTLPSRSKSCQLTWPKAGLISYAVSQDMPQVPTLRLVYSENKPNPQMAQTNKDQLKLM